MVLLMAIYVMSKDATHGELWDAWDRGHHVLNHGEGQLYNHPQGEKLGDMLSDWTVCPIGNGTCQDAVFVEMCAINPDLGFETIQVQLCPRGISGDGEKCPLNK